MKLFIATYHVDRERIELTAASVKRVTALNLLSAAVNEWYANSDPLRNDTLALHKNITLDFDDVEWTEHEDGVCRQDGEAL